MKTASSFADTLLATRLHVPTLSRRHIERPVLVARLQAGVDEGRRLTLISAPPGFGKTMLASEWLKHCGSAASWLAIDEDDNDPIRFLRYLSASVQQHNQDAAQPLTELLNSPQLPPPASLMTVFINTLTALSAPLVLALDDYHRVTNPEVHALVRQLIERQPAPIHLVIITREDPPLMLYQLRAQGLLTEIRQSDLRFSREQVAVYLDAALVISLPDDVMGALAARTEGWVTGLQLAALAIQEQPDNAIEFIRAFTGGDRYITDYLVGEVLQRLPEGHARFLQFTSILTQFTPELCDVVTERDDSASVLSYLENANVFLVPLDRQRMWYRYHQLFADVLRAALKPEEEVLLRQRALAWYEARGAAGDAWGHAHEIARLTADMSDCARIIRRFADALIAQGAITTLSQWLASLPAVDVMQDGDLSVIAGWVAALRGDFAQAYRFLERAESGFTDQQGDKVGRFLALKAFYCLFVRRDYARVADHANSALTHLHVDQHNWRLIASWLVAEAARRGGRLDAAIEAISQLIADELGAGNTFFALIVESALVSCHYLRGNLGDALVACERLIARFTDRTGEPSPLLGIAWSWLGRVYYERNDLERAETYLNRGVDTSVALGMEIYQLFAYGYRSLLLRARGDIRGALDDLQTAADFATRTQFADASWFAAWRADIQIREGDIDAAEAWLVSARVDPAQPLNYLQLETYLTITRLRIAQGAFDDAEAWLDRLQVMADEGGFGRMQITLLLLRASAADQRGSRAVLHHLAQAVRLAAGEGWIRPFLDEDERLLAWLPRVRDVAPAFVDRIINAALRPQDPDALSERELEVLRLLAAGLTTADIAGRLLIAPGTVKRHLHHIYEKMQVGSRVQAVNRARMLRLLD